MVRSERNLSNSAKRCEDRAYAQSTTLRVMSYNVQRGQKSELRFLKSEKVEKSQNEDGYFIVSGKGVYVWWRSICDYFGLL